MNERSGEAEGSTWVDPKTGLEWQCRSAGEMSWNEAKEYAQWLSLGDKSDWRLPSLSELESLLDRSRYRPVIREEVPFRDERSYWSSTTFEEDTSTAWIVMFEGAYVLSYYKMNRYHVRCVRGHGRAICSEPSAG
jgi:formylglycine-generating enzyme required for sulfatase activity